MDSNLTVAKETYQRSHAELKETEKHSAELEGFKSVSKELRVIFGEEKLPAGQELKQKNGIV